MKRAIIVHGWGGSPEEPMLQWIKKSFENKGFEVVIPSMPNPDKPKIREWVGKLREIINLDKESILIGHSIGCQGILRYLETIDQQVGKVILIAPWMHLDKNTIEEEGEEVIEIARPWMETPINWKKIKENCNNFIAIFSDNDPYVPLSNVKVFEDKLEAKVIILNNRWHFDPGNHINKLPEILQFIK